MRRDRSQHRADWHAGASFLREAGLLLIGLSAVGMLWTALALARLPPCMASI